MKTKLEICVDNLESALVAQEAGAHRLELCGELSVGGLTPSMGLIRQIREHISIPVNVMIRPRSGDFCYTEGDFQTMLADIDFMKAHYPEVNGFVTGVLAENGSIHEQRMKALVKRAWPVPITIHRAFDMSRDMEESLALCIELEIERILTGGFANRALDGIENLKRLKQIGQGKIIIMPGSGLCSENIRSLLDAVEPDEIHMSAKMVVPSLMNYQDDGLQMGRVEDVNEYLRTVTNGEEVAAVGRILQGKS